MNKINLTKQQQQTALLIGGGALLFILDKPKSASEGQAQDLVNSALDDIRNLQGQGIYPTFSQSEFEIMANVLHAALADYFGTDEKAIYQTMARLRNDADWLKLVATFGRRSEGYFLKDWYTLPQWLTADLTAYEKQVINYIFANKGMKARI